MRHKIIRTILGAVWLVAGTAILLQGNMGGLQWRNGALFLLVGAVFLFSAYKMKNENR
jgi:intracellular septation protein A